MHWFLDPITKHYADFEGRVGRQEFWMFVLFSILIQIAFDIVGLDIISMLVSLGLLVPSLALGARRLHDIGKSGWWQLLGLIPIIGWIIIIVWLATKTAPVANQYGNPAVAKATGTASAPAVATPVVASDTAPMAAGTKAESPAEGGPADGSN
ncbi:MAG: DUF805 domain-containing protein [Candidatus Pacebacteria bacterium]|jgi:uncharacterized membrane protein YhaH (DUF805 family)|nr:DUF805 domain-containing protein [Candidatus Paceibacterota bacterium]